MNLSHAVDKCFRDSKFIHWLRVDSSSLTDGNNHAATRESSGSNLMSALSGKNAQVCVPIVQVKVNNKISATAMLDTCSTTTLSMLTSESLFKESRLIPSLFVEGVSEGESIILHNDIVV